ncbi:hypothetical protein CPB97_006765 [Podila verticillata]|nr:hypothetical protein CPB97_006765 [Podila verticillata]
MFDVTELDEVVCLQLDRKSLLQCAKASKKWNAAVTPFLWRTIPKGIWADNWRSFCHLILEDFFQQQQLKEQQTLSKRPTQAIKSFIPKTSKPRKNTRATALAKYGQHIRRVELASELLLGLEHVRSARGELALSGRSPGPSALDLIRHFLRRCPNALMQFEMGHKFFNTPKLLRLSLEVLPRVNNLSIKGDHDKRKAFPVSKLKQVLMAASENLHSLTLNFLIFRSEKTNETESPTSNVSELEMTARPKRLHIKKLFDPRGCSWLWCACGQVQELEVCDVSDHVFVSLCRAIRESMISLDTVIFGNSKVTMGDYHLNDDKVMLVIVAIAATNGWKAIHCGSVARVGIQAIHNVVQNHAALEEFSATRIDVPVGISAILKFCEKLRTCKAIDEAVSGRGLSPKVPATDFHDWDKKTKALHPWACKDTLDTLAINITRRDQFGELEDDVRFHRTQQRVCERLGTFVNLKVLQLAPKAYRDEGQDECLYLTLETGLDKMAQLEKLEELYIANMDHRVGLQEVKWMVEHWPKLWKFCGLEAHTAASKWLKENYPKIQQDE